ncbi:Ribosome biogenesis protein YTM1 [Amanita muscaria]
MESTSQPVIFTTQTSFPLPYQKFFIPTSWRRYHLSQLVNKALSLSKIVPFDFLVKGEILRTSLGEWCAEHGVGEEETLEIEYIESVLPPQKLSDFPHDDWVSSVSCQPDGYFVTGSYDGIVRMFNYSRTLITSSKLHNAPITSITTMYDASYTSNSAQLVATASHDLTALLTRFAQTSDDQEDSNLSTTTTTTTTKATPLAALHLHTSPLTCITSNENSTHLLTASWDSLIGVWDTKVPGEHEIGDIRASAPGPSRKRRKVVEEEQDEQWAAEGAGVNGGPNGSTVTVVVETKNVKRKAPITVLKSHKSRVSCALFGSQFRGIEGRAYSCGFDSTVRVWDVETGLCERTINASEKAFTSLALPSTNLAVATATDRSMTMYDLRIPTTAVPAAPESSYMHPSTPSCITLPSYSGPRAQSATSSATSVNEVITGAYDGIVRMWDLRSTKSAVTSFDAFGNERDKDSKKVLAVDWNADKGVVGIGGEGGFVVWSFKEDVVSSRS